MLCQIKVSSNSVITSKIDLLPWRIADDSGGSVWSIQWSLLHRRLFVLTPVYPFQIQTLHLRSLHPSLDCNQHHLLKFLWGCWAFGPHRKGTCESQGFQTHPSTATCFHCSEETLVRLYAHGLYCMHSYKNLWWARQSSGGTSLSLLLSSAIKLVYLLLVSSHSGRRWLQPLTSRHNNQGLHANITSVICIQITYFYKFPFCHATFFHSQNSVKEPI